MLRIMRRIVAVGAVIYLLAGAGLFAIMKLPPGQFAGVVARLPAPVLFLAFPFESLWKIARRGTLEPGSNAPDFRLSLQDKSGSVQLSALRGKPVVLVFGSYT